MSASEFPYRGQLTLTTQMKKIMLYPCITVSWETYPLHSSCFVTKIYLVMLPTKPQGPWPGWVKSQPLFETNIALKQSDLSSTSTSPLFSEKDINTLINKMLSYVFVISLYQQQMVGDEQTLYTVNPWVLDFAQIVCTLKTRGFHNYLQILTSCLFSSAV